MGHSVFYLAPPGDTLMAEILAVRLRKDGHAVTVGDNPAQIGTPDLAVIEATHNQGWNAALNLKTASPTVALLVLVPEGKARPTEFRVDGDRQLVEPYEIVDLISAAKSLFDLPKGARVSVCFPTTDENVEKAREWLMTLLGSVTALDESTRFHLLTAFGEALGNAALHGNRSRRDRLVRMRFIQTPNSVEFFVGDEGPGFDWRSKLKEADHAQSAVETARLRAGAGRLGGLGLNLMKKVCSEVTFNDKGNELTLIKRF